MKTIWSKEPPAVEGPYILVGCPPGNYAMDMFGHPPDTFNNPGSIQTITKNRVGDFLKIRDKVGTPFVFADREAWWQAGGPLPGQEGAPSVNVNELTKQLTEARAALTHALERLQKVRDVVGMGDRST